MSASSPGTGNLDLKNKTERIYKYKYNHAVDSITLPYTIPHDGAILVRVATTNAKGSGGGITIDDVQLSGLSTQASDTIISRKDFYHVETGNVVDKVINSSGGDVTIQYFYD